MHYENFEQAYINELEKVYKNPDFINQPRGFKSKERLGCSFTILNPIERICYVPCRKTNIVFNFAEALWYLSGSNSLEHISYYANNMKRYSGDGKTLNGTAYGPKIFSFGFNKINQWNRAISVLKEDPDSKRCYIEIFDANEELHLSNIDVSCTLGLQFFIREGKLHMVVYMRANDAYRGVVSDLFSFSFLQEVMANQIGLKIGDLHHNVGTYHLYEPDEKMAEQLLEEKKNINSDKLYTFPEMPHKNNWSDIKVVLKIEESLRTRKSNADIAGIQSLNIDKYWKQVVALLAIYQGIYYEHKIDCKIFDFLEPIYKYLIQNRWRELV